MPKHVLIYDEVKKTGAHGPKLHITSCRFLPVCTPLKLYNLSSSRVVQSSLPYCVQAIAAPLPCPKSFAVMNQMQSSAFTDGLPMRPQKVY
jgi:hypothetical protein